MSFLSDNSGTIIDIIIAFVFAVASVVVGDSIYDNLRKRRDRLRLDFQTKQEEERLGISVRCRHGYLTDARIRCNNVEYGWETAGGVLNQKSILAGDDPSVFYPFKHRADWIDIKDFSDKLTGTPYTPIAPRQSGPVRGAVLLRLFDGPTGQEFWRHLYMIGQGPTAVMVEPGNVLPAEFPIFIKIIAKEIVEEKHYGVGLGAPLQIFDLDREKPIIRYNFSIRQSKSRFSPRIKRPLYSMKS